MIKQGVDIYTVKEFLGHTSLAMTERYVKVYLSSLKAKYDAYRVKKQQTYATKMMATQIQITQPEGEADGGWVDGKVGKLYVSPLPDGLATVCICPCMMAVLTRRIAPPVQSCVRTSVICQSGRTKPRIYSLPSKRCVPILLMHEHGKNTSRSWPMQKR